MGKVKKIVSMLTIGLLNITNKAFAREDMLLTPMYGIPSPETPIERILGHWKLLILLPLILIIGGAIYFTTEYKENKEENKEGNKEKENNR